MQRYSFRISCAIPQGIQITLSLSWGAKDDLGLLMIVKRFSCSIATWGSTPSKAKSYRGIRDLTDQVSVLPPAPQNVRLAFG